MKIIEVLSYEEMSTKAANFIIQQINQNPSSVLGLATGETTLGIYKKLVQDHCLNNTSYRNIRTLNLDEYVGLAENDPAKLPHVYEQSTVQSCGSAYPTNVFTRRNG